MVYGNGAVLGGRMSASFGWRNGLQKNLKVRVDEISEKQKKVKELSNVPQIFDQAIIQLSGFLSGIPANFADSVRKIQRVAPHD